MAAPIATIEDPSSISLLPYPFDRKLGQTRVGSSFSFRKAKKCVRPELVVSADGANANLYSIKHSRLLSSYAFSPQSRFVVPPCAVTHKKAHSYLYAGIQNGSRQETHQIQCHRQFLNQTGQPSSEESPEKFSVDIGSSDDPVIDLEPVTPSNRKSTKSPAHDMIAVQHSGRVTCFDSELQERKWSVSLESRSVCSNESARAQPEILTVAFVNPANSLEKSFLRYHPDLRYQLGGVVAGNLKSLQQVLLVGVVVCVKNDDAITENLQIFAVHLSTQKSHDQPRVSSICDWVLPRSRASHQHETPNFRLNLKRGFLTRVCRDRLQVFDILQAKPTQVFDHVSQGESITDCVIVNRSSCLIATSRQIILMDMRHRSFQAAYAHDQPDKEEASRKRKRHSFSASKAPTHALHYFEKGSIVAGINAQHITSCNISISLVDGTNKKRKQSRLADALGHGNVPGSLKASQHQDDSFDAVARIFEWTSESVDCRHSQDTTLRVKGTDHHLFSSLVAKGYITAGSVQQALSRHSGNYGRLRAVSPKDIISALTRYDPTLMLIVEVVFHSPAIGLPMLIQCVKVFLHSFEVSSSQGEDRLLKDVSDLTNGDIERELEIEEGDADRELALASALLENGLDIRANAIRCCFEKLAVHFDLRQVSKALKTSLSTHELVLMIDLLRHEMRRGGWPFHTFEEHSDISLPDDESDAITAICELLNCAVDALGIGSLLSSQSPSSEVEAEAFVVALRNEAYAVLEGVQESSFFDGFLRDFLRYRSVLDNPATSHLANIQHMENFGKGKKSREYFNSLLEPAALPISTKSIERVPLAHVTHGGEIRKRSDREISRQISQRIGPYSFETIRF